MFVDFQNHGEVLRASFTDDIHFESSHLLEEELAGLQPEYYKKVIIDFSKVRFIDSSGISLLLKWIYPMTDYAEVEIVHVSEPVRNILKICKLDQFARITV